MSYYPFIKYEIQIVKIDVPFLEKNKPERILHNKTIEMVWLVEYYQPDKDGNYKYSYRVAEFGENLQRNLVNARIVKETLESKLVQIQEERQKEIDATRTKGEMIEMAKKKGYDEFETDDEIEDEMIPLDDDDDNADDVIVEEESDVIVPIATLSYKWLFANIAEDEDDYSKTESAKKFARLFSDRMGMEFGYFRNNQITFETKQDKIIFYWEKMPSDSVLAEMDKITDELRDDHESWLAITNL